MDACCAAVLSQCDASLEASVQRAQDAACAQVNTSPELSPLVAQLIRQDYLLLFPGPACLTGQVIPPVVGQRRVE